jgi:hypothetical protein
MDYNFEPVDSLVDEIKGTAGYLSKIFSPRLSVAFAVVVGALLAFRFLLT